MTTLSLLKGFCYILEKKKAHHISFLISKAHQLQQKIFFSDLPEKFWERFLLTHLDEVSIPKPITMSRNTGELWVDMTSIPMTCVS